VLQLGRRPERGPQATDRSADEDGGYGGRAIDKPAATATGGQSP